MNNPDIERENQLASLEYLKKQSIAERTTAPVTTPDTSQDWAKLDGAVAWHLIERHADSWSEVGNMMESWLAARMAAASAPIQKEPEAMHKRQVFLDEIDAAKAGSEWLEPFFAPEFHLCYSHDEGSQAPRAKWCMLFDSLDRVMAGYMLTRDAKNWTELTKIGARTPPTPAVSQSQAAGDKMNERTIELPEQAPDTSQEWGKLDGAIAFHLIERHADGWSEVGHMMESWQLARQHGSRDVTLEEIAELIEGQRVMILNPTEPHAEARAQATKDCCKSLAAQIRNMKVKP